MSNDTPAANHNIALSKGAVTLASGVSKSSLILRGLESLVVGKEAAAEYDAKGLSVIKTKDIDVVMRFFKTATDMGHLRAQFMWEWLNNEGRYSNTNLWWLLAERVYLRAFDLNRDKKSKNLQSSLDLNVRNPNKQQPSQHVTSQERAAWMTAALNKQPMTPELKAVQDKMDKSVQPK